MVLLYYIIYIRVMPHCGDLPGPSGPLYSVLSPSAIAATNAAVAVVCRREETKSKGKEVIMYATLTFNLVIELFSSHHLNYVIIFPSTAAKIYPKK